MILKLSLQILSETKKTRNTKLATQRTEQAEHSELQHCGNTVHRTGGTRQKDTFGSFLTTDVSSVLGNAGKNPEKPDYGRFCVGKPTVREKTRLERAANF